MRKLLYCIVFLCLSITNQAQELAKKVETKYYRPSITTAIEKPTTRNETLIIEKLKTLEMNVKFDDHRIDLPYKKSEESMDNYLKMVSNAVVAKWYNRDAKGNFNTDLLDERGLNTANDADAVQAKAAIIDRRKMLGKKLLSKTYLFFYKINTIKTMQEVYNEIDARNRKIMTEFKPVKRDKEGFQMNYSVSAYRLNFNDSVSNVFYNNYWSDINNQNNENIAKWDTASFPMKYVTSISETIESSQSNDPKFYAETKIKRLSSEELLANFSGSMQSTAFYKFSNTIEDFKIKATVCSTDPLSAKIGTKEDLKRDDRYYVYEIEQDANNNQVKKRKGVARAVLVSDNKGIATGDTKPSTFQQQGGKNLYEGMLIEAKNDKGIVASAGFSLLNPNKALGGLKLGADYLMRLENSSNAYFGIDLSINTFADINPGHVSALDKDDNDLGWITNGTDKFSGYTAAIAVNFSKEIYFTQKGNIFLKPAIGIGIAMYSLNSSDNSSLVFTISDPDDSEKEIHNPYYSWTSWYVPASFALGINLSPSIVLEAKPELITRFAARTGSVRVGDEDISFKLKQNTTNATDEMKSWGFNKIDKLTINPALNVSLRLRF